MPTRTLLAALIAALACLHPLVSRAQSGRDANYADAQVQASSISTKAGPALSIKATGGATSTVSLGEVISRVEAIVRHQGRLVVLGEIGPGGAREVRIVDWANGQLADQFWAYDPAVSPDGSLIAFVRFYPLHFVEGPESQYRLYRVQASPEQNRSFFKGQLQQGRSSHADVGQPLYPAPSEKAPRRNTGLADDKAHDHLSKLAWSGDSSRVAFVDAHRGKVVVVVVPVPADASRPLPMATPPLEGLGKICLRGADPNDCTTVPQEAVTLGFEPSNKAVKLTMVERTLFPAGYAKVIPLSAFKAP